MMVFGIGTRFETGIAVVSDPKLDTRYGTVVRADGGGPLRER